MTAMLSPIIAITVTYIAFQQWKINASKESREIQSEKINIYLVTKKLLNHIDQTNSVDLNLYNEFQEAAARADFLFDSNIIDWLTDVDLSISCWINIDEIINDSKNDASKEWLEKEEGYKQKEMDKLQTAHCEILDVFKDKVLGKNA